MDKDFLFMISCKRATELLSEEADDTLSLKQKFLLRFHLALCGCCCKVKTQLFSLRMGIQKLYSDSEIDNAKGMSEDCKKKMRAALEKQLQKRSEDA